MAVAEAPQAINHETQGPSVVEQFRQGKISGYTLLRRTTALSNFLRERGYRFQNNWFPRLVSLATVSPYLYLYQLGERTRNFRVDPDSGGKLIEELRQIIPELAPPRQDAEKQAAQTRLLRARPRLSSSYEQLTLEEAYLKLRTEGISYMNFRHLAPEVGQELVDRSLAKLQPYLLGEAGSFDDFSMFQRFFRRTLARRITDYIRSKPYREVNTDPGDLDRGQREEAVESVETEDDVERQKALLNQLALDHGLSQDYTQLLMYREIDHLSYKEIAQQDPHKRSAAALRRIVCYAKAEITGRRIKNSRGVAADELLAEYKKFRAVFLRQNGRVPKSSDLIIAKKAREFPYSIISYNRVFGERKSWVTAQQEMERLIAQEASDIA